MILDPATASLATGVPVRTIQRWALGGRIVDHSDGGRLLVDVDEVVELATQRTTRGSGRLPMIRTTVAYIPCQPGRTVTRRTRSEGHGGRS